MTMGMGGARRMAGVAMGVTLMQSRVVGATPTFQKFNITPMSAAWMKWAWKLNYNPTYFKKLHFWIWPTTKSL